MEDLKPRRCKLDVESRELLHEPAYEGKDWSLRLPFCETFSTSFESMCNVSSTGFREGNGNFYTYLKDVDQSDIDDVENWISTVGSYVAIRDCLYLSFAIDYSLEAGNPKNQRTRIGTLRRDAKLYDDSIPVTQRLYAAADELFQYCMQFLSEVHCYDSADVIVAMPPSRPDKQFDLPLYLAGKISKEWGKADLSDSVRTTKKRPSVKDQETVTGKLEVLEQSIEIDRNVFQRKNVLILDDLYQSGVSMNYVAMLLQEAGARNVLGLACEKTCRNDVNRR